MENQSLLDRFNRWIRESVMLKLFSIGFLILILLIPSSWVESLIEERQNRASSVMDEVASKWSGNQTVTGPILVVPYKTYEKNWIDYDKNKFEIKEFIHKAFFLPEKLTVQAEIKPETLHRGIFDIAVYESNISFVSSFSKPDFSIFKIPVSDVLWTDAELVYGISDQRGISDNPKLIINGTEYESGPTNSIGVSFSQFDNRFGPLDDEERAGTETYKSTQGNSTQLHWKTVDDFKSDVTLNLKLKGSNRLFFLPLGKTTEVNVRGPWPNPSFDGEFLPITREVTENYFKAAWKVLHFNRPFEQQWAGEDKTLRGYEFGVRLLIPADQYQKSIRTAKYGTLIILLTFLSLFLVEIITKIRIHPFQYILVGVALIIYYTLLLSVSEHTGYNFAYLISSMATVMLVSLYSRTFLSKHKLVFFFSGWLILFYGFIFTIIQLQDYSLLLGSIGLFLILAMVMYFSRNINWYGKEDIE